MVAGARSGGSDVEAFAGCSVVDQRVGGVDGAALGSMNGGGVAEFDVVAGVVGGKLDGAVPVIADGD